MRLVVVVIVACTACGRVNFDDVARPASDAAPMIVGCVGAPASYSFVVGTSRYRIAGTDEWLNSELDCEEGPGTHLVTIESQTELDALAPLAATSPAWIGISDRITEGAFLGVTGTAPGLLPWELGAPTAGGPDCVAWDPVAGTFVDESCAVARNRICECDGIDPDPATY